MCFQLLLHPLTSKCLYGKDFWSPNPQQVFVIVGHMKSKYPWLPKNHNLFAMTTTTESTLALEWPFHMLLSKHDDSMTPKHCWSNKKTSFIPKPLTQYEPVKFTTIINPSVFFLHFGKASTTPGASEMPSLLFCTLFAEPALQLDPSSDRQKTLP